MRPALRRSAFTAIATALCVTVYGVPATAAGPHERDPVLGAVINDAIRAGGPFFTAAEQAVINRKCGYAPGEWDGYNVSIDNGVFRCSNGKKVDDGEMRALLKVAQPRITERVTTAMARPEVRAAIHDHAMAAAQRAIANLRWNDAD